MKTRKKYSKEFKLDDIRAMCAVTTFEPTRFDDLAVLENKSNIFVTNYAFCIAHC